MNDGSYRYMMSYFEPRINFKLLEGIGQRNTSVTVTFTNNGSKPYSFTKNLEIIKFDSNVTVSSLGKSNKKPLGLVDIEEYVKIKGPVFNASLTGQTSSGVKLINRAQLTRDYHPDPLHEAVFDHVEASDGYTMAVHGDNPFQAYFSLFNNNSDYLYYFSPFPGIGV